MELEETSRWRVGDTTTNLQKLDLRDNELRGTISASLAYLSDLALFNDAESAVPANVCTSLVNISASVIGCGLESREHITTMFSCLECGCCGACGAAAAARSNVFG